jgi:2C-methyl-D-erythritol 2,4-cyclodiphosphate synthase
MKNALSSVLRLDPAYIGIAAGTNEGLGYVGEGKGITVNAYVLLKKGN